jgi:hypothetical protein
MSGIPQNDKSGSGDLNNSPGIISAEQLAKIKADLTEEIQKQTELKKQIVKLLEIDRPWSNLFQQPVILLVLGFLLTSVAGTFLTSLWQEKDKRKQNAQLVKQLNLKNKTEIMNETSSLILQTYAASSDMIALFQRGELPDIREKVLLERLEYWQKTSRQWREKYPIVEREILGSFRDEQIHDDFLQVVELRGKLGVEIPNWRTAIVKKGWKLIDEKCNAKNCAPKCERNNCPATDCEKPEQEQYFFNRVRCTNIHNEEMKEKTLGLIDRMIAEIKFDETSASENEGFWAGLKRWVW